MAIFDSCGCCSLRTGAILVGFMQMLISSALTCGGVYLVSISDLEAVLQSAWKKLYFYSGPVVKSQNGSAGPLPLHMTTGQFLSVEFAILMASVFLWTSSLSNLLLIIGAAKRFSGFIIQWLVVQWISLFVVIGVLGVLFWRLLLASLLGRYWWVVVFSVGVLILLTIALFFVFSLYQTIRDEEVPEHRENIELLNRQLWMPKQYRYFE